MTSPINVVALDGPFLPVQPNTLYRRGSVALAGSLIVQANATFVTTLAGYVASDWTVLTDGVPGGSGGGGSVTKAAVIATGLAASDIGALDSATANTAYAAKLGKADAAKTAAFAASTSKPNLVNISAGSFSASLPAASSVPAGTEAYFKITAATDPAAPSTLFTVAPAGADTINGGASALAMRVLNRAKRLVSDGVSNWVVLGGDQDATVEDVRNAARYALTRGLVVNARNNQFANMVGDGTTNDWTAFNSIVVGMGALYAADGIPRVLYVPAGAYSIQNRGTVWKSGVSLVGEGAGLTRFLLSNPGDTTNPTPLATYTTAQGASTAAPLVDCTFRDFEIDGSGVTLPGGYNTGAKGLVLQYMVRARFQNLYIHDTAASGLGCDFLQDSVIHAVVANNCGRLNDGTQPGGAGIGIGIGGWGSVERTTISDCTAVGNGTHGIFVELQNSAWTRPRGIRITGGHVEGNKYGISDWGADGLVVANCTVLGNLHSGINVTGSGVGSSAGTGGTIHGCTIDGNAGPGILTGDTGRYSIRGNRVSGNLYGIRHANISGAASSLEQVIDGNDVWGNALDGVRVDSPISDAAILNNRIRNNGQQSAATSTNTGGTVTYAALTLTDSAAAWVVNSQLGKTVTVGALTAVVRSNTATVLTLFPARPNGTTAWTTGTPAAGTAYTLPAAPTTRAALTFNAAVAHPIIRGGRFWDNQTTKTQTHAWSITSTGTCTSGEVTDNDLQANLTGVASFTTAPSGGHWAFNNGLAATTLGSPTTSLIDGPLAWAPVTTTTAPTAGAGGALPTLPAGYMTVALNGTSRQIPYY